MCALVALIAGVLAIGSSGAGAVRPVRSVRGFDGTTIKVASIGVLSQFPGDTTGVDARVKRFNDTNEIKGIKIEHVEAVDDKVDPTTALTEARRLVTQEQIFAMVGDVSPVGVGDYYNQQHVPDFGAGYNASYCSSNGKIDTSIYSFGFAGCLTPPAPKNTSAQYVNMYKYVSGKTGKKQPTIALYGDDTASSKTAQDTGASAAAGAGFKVVYHGAAFQSGPVSDYTPAAQTLLTSDNGNPPGAMNCLVGASCVGAYAAIKANGYTGTSFSVLYSDILVKAMAGSAVTTYYNNLSASTPGVEQMKTDVEAVKPGAKVDGGTVAGYTSTDMFIAALKTVAKKGTKNITPENVQKAAMKQTWELKGLAGPTKYPDSTQHTSPTCTTISVSDGTAWNIEVPYSCSNKSFPIKK